MILQELSMRGMMILALALTHVPMLQAQETGNSPGESPADSLVLVLNVISQTHARPATGVVLATGGDSEFALVAVPADFVSAGDRIVVLDGGNDLLKHGRSSRTVARSLEAGVALLEVKGLRRTGVELSSDVWPPTAAGAYLFAAWPPAEALAEGTPMIQRNVRLGPGPGSDQLVVNPNLPAGSGPIFDLCGRMAALHLGDGDGRLVGVGGLEKLARSVDREVTTAPCAAESASAALEISEAPQAQEAVSPRAGAESPGAGMPSSETAGDLEPGSGRKAWWLLALLIGLAGLALYLRNRKGRIGPRIVLEGQQPDGRSLTCEVRFPEGDDKSLLERAGRTLEFRIHGERAFITQPDEPEPDVLALSVDGTPCLPGEVVALPDGAEIQWRAERFRARLELDRAYSA